MTTTTINKAELLSAALSAVAEDRDVKAHGLNAAAVAAYIPEIVEAAYMPDEIPVTMTGREIDAALLNGADDWKHYAKGGCAAICGTYEILVRHHGEKEAAAIVDAADDDSDGLQALNEQATYLANAAGVIYAALVDLIDQHATDQEKAQRAFRGVMQAGAHAFYILQTGFSTTKTGATYKHYRVLSLSKRGALFDVTYWMYAALGFRQTKNGEISLRGFMDAPTDIKDRLQGLKCGPVTVEKIL